MIEGTLVCRCHVSDLSSLKPCYEVAPSIDGDEDHSIVIRPGSRALLKHLRVVCQCTLQLFSAGSAEWVSRVEGLFADELGSGHLGGLSRSACINLYNHDLSFFKNFAAVDNLGEQGQVRTL